MDNRLENIKKKLALLPLKPGCYLMKDITGTIIYVGKAKKLKNRVSSYFNGTKYGKTKILVSNIHDFEYIVTSSEKEALLEQYCILTNQLGSEENVRILFATAYNRYGEGKPWRQGRVRQFFSDEELCISKDFWNLVCKSENGYDIVIDEYKKNAHLIISALSKIKMAYLPDAE